MRHRVILLALAALVFASPAVTEDNYRVLPRENGDYTQPSGILSEKQLGWFDLTNFFENQHTFLLARLDQGYWLFLQIFTFKYGPQQQWGIYGIVSDDAGKRWFAKRQISQQDITLSKNSINWSSKGTSVSGAYPQYKFTIKEDAFQGSFVVDCLFPGWAIGKTYITPDKKTYSENYMYIPWGKISGTLVLDGANVPVTGNAYADRFHGNQRFDRADPLYYGVHGLSPMPGSADISIQTTYNHFHPGFGKVTAPGLTIMGPKGFIKGTLYNTIQGEEFTFNKELGYYFPKRLIVKSDIPGFKFRGVFTVQKPIQVLDILAQLPPYIRKIADMFFKVPVFSKFDGVFDGSYTLDGKETQFKLRALAEINYIGGRDAVPQQ